MFAIKAMDSPCSSDPLTRHDFTEPVIPDDVVSTGTTIVAAKFDGGVVMGADSRTSIGTFVSNRASRKLTQLHDRIFVGRSGSAADTQMLSGYVTRFLRANSTELGTLPTVNTAASLTQLLISQNKHLLAGSIIGGWDPKEGGSVYQIPLGGSKFKRDFAAGGSGSSYITAYANEMYKPNMTKQECIAFVKQLIAHAVSIDGSSGGMIRWIVITEDGVEDDYTIADGFLEKDKS